MTDLDVLLQITRPPNLCQRTGFFVRWFISLGLAGCIIIRCPHSEAKTYKQLSVACENWCNWMSLVTSYVCVRVACTQTLLTCRESMRVRAATRCSFPPCSKWMQPFLGSATMWRWVLMTLLRLCWIIKQCDGECWCHFLYCADI